ncbi:transcription antitermination factor NusB [Caloranaerobacter azorensis]|uniref:Transcription antitermination protein NusB n=1 Tax=Caloranaerobacter azorensis TaxID=116090 RepID=A0A6P1YAV9_9FIRM|nr:transcription antitermination factor NusB [Caloranaerobacter azorensis]QIB26012.1 transcription antitermination factor NusB [Caloranaerobacter azorensis]
MSRKIAREEAVKLLYQMEMNEDFSEQTKNEYLKTNNFKEDEVEYLNRVFERLIEKLPVIDSKIEKYSEGWKINRIAKVDLSILRLAIFEIMYMDDIPIEVSINEALEISKKYSTEESSKFINGLLGSFVKEWNDING